MANALGWFSLGLGLAQIAAPHSVARWIGLNDDEESRRLMRTVGLREIASGVGILTRPRPAGWLWTRVAGDVMDLALLGSALHSDRAQRERVAATTAAVVGVTLLDLFASGQLTLSAGEATEGSRASRALHISKSMTINRPREELYQFWHNFESLPRFMCNLESVEVTGAGRSRWRAKGPAGMTVEWEAEVIDDRPNERIAWRSVEGSEVSVAGEVRFVPAPAGQGTEVQVEMDYRPPGGVIGAQLSRLLGADPAMQVQEDLRRFKQLMEVGEIVLSDASLGRDRPAQPPPSLPER